MGDEKLAYMWSNGKAAQPMSKAKSLRAAASPHLSGQGRALAQKHPYIFICSCKSLQVADFCSS
ncbi:hypothetical protein SAMN06265784_10962 [Paraburkholderia susongensis]|uniref:Uncharacterized protein n=1 Tax=Paraburkholderia susongensis TaxID=1515439 RepID=A0A1X7LUA3_9BURK|nr:hypothetical protein SAMN06265784_10962 [Paraburkholderia susongensis]